MLMIWSIVSIFIAAVACMAGSRMWGAALKIKAQHGSDAWVRYNRLLYAIRYAGYGLFALGVIAYITYGG